MKNPLNSDEGSAAAAAPEIVVYEWEPTVAKVEGFPVFLGELAELCRTLAVVLSSRCDYLRQKLKEDPNCLKQGTTGMKLMLQLATAAQNGVYVLQKANFVLRYTYTFIPGCIFVVINPIVVVPVREVIYY